MSDDVDRTQERIELEEKLRRQYAQIMPEHKPTGKCLYCGEKLSEEKRWCDAYCREDFELLMLKRNR